MDVNTSQIVLVKDIYPGIDNDYYSYTSNHPKHLTEFNNKLYFSADNGETGQELWVSDGTTEGTQLLKDINPGDEGSDGRGNNNRHFTEVNDKLYFTADDDKNGKELWVTDGTTEGTQLLKDIDPSTSDSKGSYPGDLTEFNNKLYFRAGDDETGYELWVSDGTTKGTQLLKDLYPGSSSGFRPSPYNSFPEDFTEFNNKLYFTAADDKNGKELWVTDGTAENTQLLKDIAPADLTELNGKLYFSAGDETGNELWVTDGTTKGTQLVKDIYPGSTYYPRNYTHYVGEPENYSGFYKVNSSSPRNSIEFDGKLYFTAKSSKDGKKIGNELWVTDGTTEGTQLVKDINSNNDSNIDSSANSSYADNFIEFNDRLYFIANDGKNGMEELWVSDGTPQGTQLFKDINPGSDSSFANNLTIFNNKLYFSAYDGKTGGQLWVSNGTAEGTQLVADINPTDPTSVYYPSDLIVVGDELFFTADNGETGRELFKLTVTELEKITGTNLSEILIGTEEADRIEGLKGDDTLGGKAGNDVLNGGAGDDVLFGVEGHDTLTGGDGNDLLRGQSGNDVLKGGMGDDTLFGGNQFDRLNGGDGDDYLDGVGGITIYNGGAGSDRFVIHDDSQTDWIQDFEVDVDKIELAGAITFDRLEITGRVNSFISFQGEQIGALLDVAPDDLDKSNFQKT